MDPNDMIRLDPTMGGNPYHRLDDRGRYADGAMEMMYKLIEAQCLAAVGVAEPGTYKEKQDDMINALATINSAWFDQLCDDIGLDISHVLPKIKELAEERINRRRKALIYQMILDE